jgi:hypothetical protein
MTDTSETIQNIYRAMIMSKSGEERLKMGCSMYDTAKAIAISSIKNYNPTISEKELLKEVFLRFYGFDFAEEEKKKILRALFS